VTLCLTGALLLVAGPAHAASAEADFGQHVRECAQAHGFSGDHNPGRHQGKSGWHADHHDC
jgi:hypothetical protein